MPKKYDLRVCTDCLFFIEYGAVPEERPFLSAAVSYRWPTQDLVVGTSEDGEPGFSWSACDCCGSTLGGDRHVAWAFED